MIQFCEWFSTTVALPHKWAYARIINKWHYARIISSGSICNYMQPVAYTVIVFPLVWFTGWIAVLLPRPSWIRRDSHLLLFYEPIRFLTCSEEAPYNGGRNVEIEYCSHYATIPIHLLHRLVLIDQTVPSLEKIAVIMSFYQAKQEILLL